jgi:hypothetical protein
LDRGKTKRRSPSCTSKIKKPIVLNRTNTEALEDAFGDSDDWPGNKIKIRCVKTNYAGKTVDGLRVEPTVPKPALKDELNDEVPL